MFTRLPNGSVKEHLEGTHRCHVAHISGAIQRAIADRCERITEYALLLGGCALDAEPGDTSGEVGAVDAIAVVDQVLGVVARGVASIIWRQTQAALGWAVTSTWSRRRRSWLIRRKTYRVWKVRV
jgi:hypothetical protein